MSEQKHERIINQLFAHPVARNIEWTELIPALSSIGQLEIEKNGNYRLNRNGHTLVFEASHDKEVDMEEVLKLRHFLESSEASEAKSPNLIHGAIVAIDHHQATIYRDPDAGLEQRVRLHADLTEQRILHSHPTTAPFHGLSPLPENDYYESIIKEMAKSEKIVILSHGTGTSNAGSQLLAIIRKDKPDLTSKIVAIKDCDLEAMTEPELIKLGTESLRGN